MSRTPIALIVLAASALTLASCGGDDDQGSAALATVPATVTASSAPSTIAAGDGCSGDVVAKVTKNVVSDAVTEIKLIGGCSMVNITTSLADDQIKPAMDICDAAAAVAYVGNTSAVSVVGSSGKQLSDGVKDYQCIGEP